MAWSIEFDPSAARELKKLDPQVARHILKFLFERIATTYDPRRLGAALKGSKLGDFWKYRVGDHRIIAHIEDRAMLVLVLRIGHRREVYR
jgi:mRNA interferase RelE/StbE